MARGKRGPVGRPPRPPGPSGPSRGGGTSTASSSQSPIAKRGGTRGRKTRSPQKPHNMGRRGGRGVRGKDGIKEEIVDDDMKSETPSHDEKSDLRSLPLAIVAPHLTCYICKGWLVDATTVIECLHTFCKSCLLNYFEDDNTDCPKCNQLIHQSHPSHYCSYDRTIQDIVYKLVPGLFDDERKRRADFAKAERKRLGLPELPEPKKKTKEEEECTNRCFEGRAERSHHRKDEQLIVTLRPVLSDFPGVTHPVRNVIRLSGMATINTLKRYLAIHMYNDVSKYSSIDIFCNRELMGKDYSMKFIQLTRWRDRSRDEPLDLVYRKHIEY